jgi:hypothetical protein
MTVQATQDFSYANYGLQQGVGTGGYPPWGLDLDPQGQARSSALDELLRWPNGESGQS